MAERRKLMLVSILVLVGMLMIAVIFLKLNGSAALDRAELQEHCGSFSFLEEHRSGKHNRIDSWTLTFADGTWVRVNTTIGFDADAFYENVRVGDDLVVLAKPGEQRWVQEIRRGDDVIHALETSQAGEAENRRMGNVILGAGAALLVWCEAVCLRRVYGKRKRR